MTTVLERYHDSTRRLEALIEGTPPTQDHSLEAVQTRATWRMNRLRRFLTHLGDPHLGYPIVHVGGTSGKGSTSTTIASILVKAGYRTGLHTSPYLQSPTEKLQVDGRLIAPQIYSDLIDSILEAHQSWIRVGESVLTYGEIWMALTMMFFRQEQVEIAVLEVGAGGRFDLTNVVTPTLSVITSVAIDHTNTLGDSIAAIAWHKAGIIKPGVPTVTAVTSSDALAIIREEAHAQGSRLTVVQPEINVADQETDASGTRWRNNQTGQRHAISLRGRFQALNGATAVAAVDALTEAGMHIDAASIAAGLSAARIPGRAELVDDIMPVLLDGAHNAEKIAAIVADTPALLRRSGTGRRFVIMGVLEAKSAVEMISSVTRIADVLIATSPRVLAKTSRTADEFADLVRQAGFRGQVEIQPCPADAVQFVFDSSRGDNGDSLLITGSLYLIGNVRERWFRHDDIVMSQTSWPVNDAVRSPTLE